MSKLCKGALAPSNSDCRATRVHPRCGRRSGRVVDIEHGLLLLLVIGAGALFVGACGGGMKAASSRVGSERSAVPGSGSWVPMADGSKAPSDRVREEKQAHETAIALQRTLTAVREGRGNAALGAYALCEHLLSVSVRRELIRSASAETHSNDCETAVTYLLERPGRKETLAAVTEGQTVEVQVNGTRGTATFRLSRGKTVRLRLVKEDGGWKLATAR